MKWFSAGTSLFTIKPIWLDDALDYYKIPYFYGSQRKAELLYGFIYFLTVPSLNIQGGLHQILMSLTADRGIEVFDPVMGRPGAKYYVLWQKPRMMNSLA
ncbi:Uncharacterised protein [Raoultella planticola]|uniref:hypothetical protein n=1 Tax=Raoultella planticola TaxID=575 RepID=UPI000D9DCF3D|nr:hypothetical protein [Raoultella planticola]SQA60902.1 Uncharacterised protein [Raoultella planticola]